MFIDFKMIVLKGTMSPSGQSFYLSLHDILKGSLNTNVCFCRCGFLDGETIRTVFHAHHVPLPDDLLRAAIAA